MILVLNWLLNHSDFCRKIYPTINKTFFLQLRKLIGWAYWNKEFI